MRKNEKVKIKRPNKPDVFGTIISIYEPNEYHSGRFIVQIHEHHFTHVEEFWFNDYGKSVVGEGKDETDN